MVAARFPQFLAQLAACPSWELKKQQDMDVYFTRQSKMLQVKLV
jgi:hypothetical protein